MRLLRCLVCVLLLLSGVQGAALSGSDYAGCRRFYLETAVRACGHSRFNFDGAGVVGICTVTVAAVGGENRRMLPSERSAGAPVQSFLLPFILNTDTTKAIMQVYRKKPNLGSIMQSCSIGFQDGEKTTIFKGLFAF